MAETFQAWGLFSEAGPAERFTNVCALTGQRIVGGGVTCRIKGTRLFYKLSPTARRKITHEQREEIEAKVKSAYAESIGEQTATKLAEEIEGVESETIKNISDLSKEELKVMAEEMGLAVPSKATKEVIIALIESAEIIEDVNNPSQS